jgi:glycosyltransferase involved in cell wall biosynthesis
MKVLALVTSPVDMSPGQRFRVEQWASYLKRDGVSVTFAPLLSAADAAILKQRGQLVRKTLSLFRSFVRRFGQVRDARRYDLVYIHRETSLVGPAVFERLLHSMRVPSVFDFDDAIWVRYVSPANSVFSFLRCPGKTATTCRLSRAVIAGNRYLAAYAGRFSESVHVVPTTIDTLRCRPRAAPRNSQPVIGWTGSFSTVRYLDLIRPALERLRLELPFRFVTVGATGFRPDGVEVEERPWSPDRELDALADVDVGVMPLTDGPWERGKCGFKALQYMALGIPPVVSPVGVNTEIVCNEQNGLLASSPEDWERSLARLLRDAESRQRIGAAGRSTVERRYSAQVHAPRVAEILRGACT